VGATGEQASEPIKVQEPVPYCVRCGFVWSALIDPATALTRRLINLSNEELCQVMKLFYPNFHNLVSEVARAVNKSIGHVQRVLDSERRSVVIDTELVMAFRRRLITTGTARLL
jgi:hypothetical protein